MRGMRLHKKDMIRNQKNSLRFGRSFLRVPTEADSHQEHHCSAMLNIAVSLLAIAAIALEVIDVLRLQLCGLAQLSNFED